MTVLTTGGVTAADASIANLLGWAVLLLGIIITAAWLFSLYR